MGCLFVWNDLAWRLPWYCLFPLTRPLLGCQDVGIRMGVLTLPPKMFRVFMQSFLGKWDSSCESNYPDHF